MPRAVSHVVVGAVYHPPSADDRAMTSHILDCLDTVARDHPHAGCGKLSNGSSGSPYDFIAMILLLSTLRL